MALQADIQALHRALTERALTVAVAESCSGGRLAAALTSLPGASAYFLGGVVTYADAAKIKLLEVSPALLAQYGAVSKPVAIQMAVHVRKLLAADYGLAITGIAGPGGATLDKPVGTVWAALSSHRAAEAWLMLLCGTRTEIIDKSCHYALNRLLYQFFPWPPHASRFLHRAQWPAA
jgi:nicotinamide-nucleotide amidase